MVTLISYLTQGQVKFRSKGRILKLNISFLKHAYLDNFCLRIPKNVICFGVRQLEMAKIAVQKRMSSLLPFFLVIASQK